MTSSSRSGPRQVPPPGGKPASVHARFIPREELQDFAAWQPHAIDGGGSAAPPLRPASAVAAEAAAAAAAEQTMAPPSLEEIDAAIDAARQAGYEDGYRDGLVALEGFKQNFARQSAGQVGAWLAAFDAQLQALDGELAQAITRTATLLARQVVRSELQLRPELVAEVASQAINTVLLSARHILVQVHPDDLPLVELGAAEALAARGARLLASPQIARGGCLVESDVGSVDARIETRWAQAAAAFGQRPDGSPLDDATLVDEHGAALLAAAHSARGNAAGVDGDADGAAPADAPDPRPEAHDDGSHPA